MPVTEEQVGYSEFTASKTFNFRKIVEMHTIMCKGIISRNSWCDGRYFYLDLTAGTGLIPSTSEPNCASIMVRTLRSVGIEFQAHLIDQNNADTLRANFNDRSSAIQYYKSDHNTVLEDIINKQLKQPAYGLMFYDPNSPGISNGNWLSLNSIANAYREHSELSKVDLMMYLSGTAVKRANNSVQSSSSTQKRLQDWLATIDKKYWVVRKPQGMWQWTFILGTNWDAYPKISSISFYPSSTPEGRNYFDTINFTSEELQRMNRYQLSFLDLDVQEN